MPLPIQTPMHPTDANLVAAACQGDLASFGQLYERYYRLAVGIARSRLSDGHLAEDAAQEAFAVACRTLSTLQNGERFPQWLGTICRRTAARIAAGLARYEELSESEAIEPAGECSRRLLRQQVQEALEELDESSREIVYLHYFSGMSYDEIASVTELSPPAIHGRLQRARCRLAEALDPSGARG